MLPKIYVKEDASWIASLMIQLDPKNREVAKNGYDKVWCEEWDKEPLQHRKENKARFAANTRLRMFVEKVKK